MTDPIDPLSRLTEVLRARDDRSQTRRSGTDGFGEQSAKTPASAARDGESDGAVPLSELTRSLQSLADEGESISIAELTERFPSHVDELTAALHLMTTSGTAPQDSSGRVRARNESLGEEPVLPDRVGRYQIKRIIGAGGFGVVYEGFDEQLSRKVAIKMAKRLPKGVRADEYLAEARVLASMDHPSVVPVYDVGKTPNGEPFIVSKLIGGSDLAQRMRAARFAHSHAAKIVTRVAQALDYSHQRGIVHRDIKPGNILLDEADRPVVVDFGLAINEADFGRGATFVGTPAFMSPEQARQEGHRVDGRTDIYSLGAVFYQMLTGNRPFQASSVPDLLDLVRNVEVRPPRQFDRTIPRELERICLKALSKKVVDRYNTAQDMADDLVHWAHLQSIDPTSVPALSGEIDSATDSAGSGVRSNSGSSRGSSQSNRSESSRVAIIPRGLRAFQSDDADFFLDLIPGPRDRDGLPESVRFWKSRIESTDPDDSFSVGVLLGPSGSGKSSLIRAGVAPHLDESVLVVQLEANPQDLESRLLRRIKRVVPALEAAETLREALLAIRLERGLPSGRKIVLVLDQFEQWLNHHAGVESSELVDALRQCDGVRVQALLLIRDDFTLAATQFMDHLEQPLSQTTNFDTVELFSPQHAKRVLQSFGRAYGALGSTLTREQRRFIDAAVESLALDGRISPIQIALFSEMIKDKSWTTATLRQSGGTEGIGIAFLETKLNGKAAHPFLQSHADIVRQVLTLMLPEKRASIKGRAKTRSEILNHVADHCRADTLDRILELLDGEIRLITPTGSEFGGDGESTATLRQPAFQLAHDYLVPTIRSWLTAAESSTRAGRASLRLRELTSLWTEKQSLRYLPSEVEWLQFRWLTSSRRWSADERRMLSAAGRRMAVRWGVATLLVGLLLCGVFKAVGRSRTFALRDRLLDAKTSETPEIIAELTKQRGWMSHVLKATSTDGDDAETTRRRLHVAMALSTIEPNQALEMLPHLDDVEASDLPAVLTYLAPHREMVSPKLWEQYLGDADSTGPQRLIRGALLAGLDAENPQWEKECGRLVAVLSEMRSFQLGSWMELFQPLRTQIAPAIVAAMKPSAEQTSRARENLLSLAAVFLRDEPDLLAASIQDAAAKDISELTAIEDIDNAAVATALERRWRSLQHTPPPVAADAETLQLLCERSQGVLTGTAGIALAVEDTEVANLHELAREAGYHLTSIRPHPNTNARGNFTVCLVLAEGPSEIMVRGTAEQLRAAHQQHAEQKLSLVDVARHPQSGPNQSDQFCAVWRSTSAGTSTLAVLGEPLTDHVKAEPAMKAAGRRLLRYLLINDPLDGAAVWGLWSSGSPTEAGGTTRYRPRCATGDVYPGYWQTDIRLLPGPASELSPRHAIHLEAAKVAISEAQLDRLREQVWRLRAGDVETMEEVLAQMPDKNKATVIECRATAAALRGDLEALALFTQQFEEASPTGRSALALLRLRAAVILGDDAAVDVQLKLLEELLQESPTSAAVISDIARGYGRAATMERGGEKRVSRAIEILSAGWLSGDLGPTVFEEIDFDELRKQEVFRAYASDAAMDTASLSSWTPSLEVESRSIFPNSVGGHLQEARSLLAEGYLPTCAEIWPKSGSASRDYHSASVWSRALPNPEDRWQQSRRLAVVAVALAHFGQSEHLLEVLRDAYGREPKGYAIQLVEQSRLPTESLVNVLRKTDSVLLRQSLLTALAKRSRNDFSAADWTYLQNRAMDLARTAREARVRAAAEYCLHCWGQSVKDITSLGDEEADWLVNSLGQVMVTLDAPEISIMGSTYDEVGRGRTERRHPVRLGRKFSIASTETTVAQFRKFLDHLRTMDKSVIYDKTLITSDEAPQISIRWFDAARYCQWLSENERLPEEQWCFPGIWDKPEAEWELPADYLSRTGYRLATEAEWEYACRGNSTWSRSFGGDPSLLKGYAWYAENSDWVPHPVAQLKPNDFGVFDMLGNVSEWCLESYKPYATPYIDFAVTDLEDKLLTIPATKWRVIRGGSYESRPIEARSSNRTGVVPSTNSPRFGIRLVRTVK
jgi:serine/threonine protein kinase/formylglycine-generating enzyme required for sulfatase activity